MRRLGLCLLLAACGDATVAPSGSPDEEVPLPPPYDPSAELFVPDDVLEVEISLAAADWDALREQSRDLFDVLGDGCLEQPRDRPFTFFEADVTVNGTTLRRAGVRKKGFIGSLHSKKPSLKIDFGEYVQGQRLAGLRKMTLNNARQDRAFVRQCLGYEVFRAAGVPASRCNFARVAVNGEALGLYVHVEPVGKPMLARWFDSDRGNLYEGALSDFRPDWLNTFEKKTHQDDPDRSELAALTAALEAPDAELLAAIEPLVDVAAFVRFLAAESLIHHWDGYGGNTNNFYVYDDPTSGKLHFLPWGIDGTFVDNGFRPRSVMARGMLAFRLYGLEAGRARYADELERLLIEVWDGERLVRRIDEMSAAFAGIPDPYGPREPDQDPGGPPNLAAELTRLKSFVRSREALLFDEIDAGAPPWSEPLREPPCLVSVGSADAGFDTTWGTRALGAVFQSGTGSWDVTLHGTDLAETAVGSDAGWSPDNPNEAQIQIAAALADGRYGALFVVVFDPRDIVAGNTVPLDFDAAFGVLFVHDPTTQTTTAEGLLVDGALTFAEGGTAGGDPIVGTLTTNVTVIPW